MSPGLASVIWIGSIVRFSAARYSALSTSRIPDRWRDSVHTWRTTSYPKQGNFGHLITPKLDIALAHMGNRSFETDRFRAVRAAQRTRRTGAWSTGSAGESHTLPRCQHVQGQTAHWRATERSLRCAVRFLIHRPPPTGARGVGRRDPGRRRPPPSAAEAWEERVGRFPRCPSPFRFRHPKPAPRRLSCRRPAGRWEGPTDGDLPMVADGYGGRPSQPTVGQLSSTTCEWRPSPRAHRAPTT